MVYTTATPQIQSAFGTQILRTDLDNQNTSNASELKSTNVTDKLFRGGGGHWKMSADVTLVEIKTL